MTLHEHSANQRNVNSPYLTRGELAARLRTSPITVTRRWKGWGLKPVRVGGRVLFAMSDVERFERRLSDSGERA